MDNNTSEQDLLAETESKQAKERSDSLNLHELWPRVKQAQQAFGCTGYHLAIWHQPDEASHPAMVSFSRGLSEETHLNDWELLLPIDSNTKLVTIFALGKVLRDHGLDLDTPIKKVLPEFELATPGDAERWTSRDICSHVTGMPRYDEVFTQGMTAHELMIRLKHLKPTFPLRARYQYSNITFAILDVMIERLSGISYQEYVIKEVLKPLGMKYSSFAHKTPIVQGYWTKADKDGVITRIPVMHYADQCPAWSAGAGLLSNGRDMLKWLNALTEFPDYGVPSAARDRDTFPYREYPRPDATYGLGLVHTSHRDVKTLEHMGAWGGYRSVIINAPDIRLRIAILCNSADPQFGYGFPAWLRATLLDHFAGLPQHDWLTEIKNAGDAELRKEVADYPSIKASRDEKLLGTYNAPGFLTWELDQSNNVDERPECTTTLPSSKILAYQKPLFASLGEGKFEACFELTDRDSGEVLYGDPFQADLRGDKLFVYGLSGLEGDLDPKDHPIIFMRQ